MVQYDFNLREYWRILRKRKFMIVFTMLSLGIFSFFFAVMGTPTPVYKASASVKIDKTSPVTGLYIQAVSWSPSDDMQTQVAIIKSYYILELTAKRLGIIPGDVTSEEIRSNTRYQKVITNLKNRVESEQEGNSNIINISVTSEDPKFAQKTANTITQVFKDERILEINRRTYEAKKFIEDQLKIVKEKLKNSEETVRDFREKNKLVSLDAQTSSLLGQMTGIKAAYDKAVADRRRITEVKQVLSQAEHRPLSSNNSFHIDEASALYKNLNDRLVQLMLERDTLLLTYTDEYPQVAELKKKIHEIIVTMRAQLASQEKVLTETIRRLAEKTADLDSQIKGLPEKGLELARLERDVKLNTEVYTLLEQKHQEVLIKEAEKIEDVQIVRPALEPTIPINPPKIMETAVVGILMGLILGIVFAFIIETFDTSMGTIEEVEKFLGIPVLGVIPHIGTKEIRESLGEEYVQKIGGKEDRITRLVAHFAPKSTLAESYRSLRTNLNFACREKNIKTIVFTSASPREGKTTTVVNLAITTAQTGAKVLLVEADLRRPVIAGFFGIDQTPGLTDVLLGNYEFGKAVKTIEDIMAGKLNIDDILETPGIDNLHIIPSGSIPLNPSELISSKSLNEFINWAKSEYDVVMMDLPPVLAATDAAIVSSRVDGVVIVYRVGKISRNALRRAKNQLDNVKAHVLGVILNGLRAEASADFSAFEREYYYYYHGGGEREKTLLGNILSRIERAKDSVKRLLQKKPGPEKDGSEEDRQEERKSRYKMIVSIVAAVLLVLGAFYQLGYFPKNLFISHKAPTRVEKPAMEAGPLKKPAVESPAAPPALGKPEPPKETAERNADPGVEQKAAGERAADAKAQASGQIADSFTIQIKAYRDIEDTKKLLASLTGKGLKPFWTSVDVPGQGLWYRIFVGQFATRKEAVNYIRQAGLNQSFPDCFVQKMTSLPDRKNYKF
ncbi:MAG: AAA family ATPase [Syntrophales bacterium]